MSSKMQMFENRLSKVWKHQSKLARKQNVSCFRFYDHDMPEFPFSLEIYEDIVFGSEYKRKHGMTEEEHELWHKDAIETISKVVNILPEKIYLRERKRIFGRTGQYEKTAQAKEEKIVQESCLSFIINLTDYLDSGLFLDHRLTRQRVREDCAGKRVLN